MISWIARIVVVVALLGVAAAIATPPGRLPLALRGIQKLVGSRVPRDRPGTSAPDTVVSRRRRLLAFVLVLFAALLCLV